MSRADRIVARKMEAKRPARVVRENAGPGRRRAVVKFDGLKAYPTLHSDHHKQGNEWWREKYADLVERRQEDGTYTPRSVQKTMTVKRPPSARPPLLPRPEGMSRQVYRYLSRHACKANGVLWKVVK